MVVQHVFELGSNSLRGEEIQQPAATSGAHNAGNAANVSLIATAQQVRDEMARTGQLLDRDIDMMTTITGHVRDYLGERFTTIQTNQTNVEQDDEPAAAPLTISGTIAHTTVWSAPRQRSALLTATAVRQWIFRHQETLWIVTILLIAALAHGINMLHFPYYEDDEGTYMSQAWAVIKLGRLASYTYWYDHAPGGWIQIAGWALFTGGFHTFGNIIA